ncbi:YjfB family protein [Paenibacillus nasutitermitis]|uniref:Motility protein n=1 Tax=Paenibacillus nasutitermitis TaxID=1652958 RepID=A0A917E0X9_9BACL|nr:YjfB family protein [Paenibacillus nasutitermitis]GGD86514.1 hypothetical protein GCM10010911_51230 [Paenibacillus nasutitermitis]
MNIAGIGALLTGQPSGGPQQQQVELALLDSTLDMVQENAQHLVQMMERSVQPHLGSSIDIRF